jgi:hypothetical protein
VPVLDDGLILPGEIHQPMVERPRKTRRRSSHRKAITGRNDDARYDKVRVARESSNTAIRTGKLEKVMHKIVEDLKPEAAYFFPTGGERGGFFIVDMQDSSQIADMAERFFFGLDAKVEFAPVMSAADLEKGLSSVQNTIQRYG